jgi:UDP-3-O-[3-hydroxymyristoyl] glucosamine N-acyltransferase
VAKGSLSFLANPAYTQFVYGTTAICCDHRQGFPELTAPVRTTLVRVSDAQGAFAKVLAMYNRSSWNKKGIASQAVISEGATLRHGLLHRSHWPTSVTNAKLGNNVKIYPQAYIGDNVTIGDNTTIFAGVTIYSDCVVGPGLHHPQRHGDR